MTVRAIIMAGGQSERMRSTLGPQHKALAEVLGSTLLERNVCKLLGEGFLDLTIAIGRHEVELRRYIESKITPMVRSAGGNAQCLIEEAALGSIGACGLLDKSGPLLVIFVDNLSSVSYRDLLATHLKTQADVTIATHLQPFRIPFGEVVAEHGSVIAYHEKPARNIKICSGLYALGEHARTLVGQGRRMSAHELVNQLLEHNRSVREFFHDCAWIDVNDAKRLSEAQQLVVDRSGDFECWGKPHSHEVELLVVSDRSPVQLLIGESAGLNSDAEEGRLPVSQSAEKNLQQTAETILNSIETIARSQPVWLASYDRIETSSGRVIRRHLFSVEIDSLQGAKKTPPEFQWIEAADLGSYKNKSLRRAWEYFTRSNRHRHAAPPH